MRQIFFIVVLVQSLGGFCQELIWESGVLITKNNEVLTGSLVYHAAHDAVLLKHNEKVDFYPAHKIQSLRFYDSKAEINRQFVSFEKNEFFSANALVEIVINGSVKIIRRLKSRIDELGRANDANDFEYYILANAKIVRLEKFKAKILPILLEAHSFEMKNFIEQESIDLNTKVAAFSLIKEHNRLNTKPTAIAAIR